MARVATQFRSLVVALAVIGTASAATVTETFSSDPAARGWRTFGEASLFRWNATNQNLEVTWDSSHTNSYFWLPLQTILTRSDTFSLGFDLTLHDIAYGTSSNKPYTFEIAVGLLNFAQAVGPDFNRGNVPSASAPRNILEFDYFPDSGYGATFAQTILTTNRQIYYGQMFPLEMTAGDLFHVDLSFTASNRTLRGSVKKNGGPFATLPNVVLPSTTDFRCDTLAIMSYSDAVQYGNPLYWGSVLAHGVVDNLTVTVPDPAITNVVGTWSNGTWRTSFAARTNWIYSLERSTDLISWTNVTSMTNGSAPVVALVDTNSPGQRAFYRVAATKP